MTCTATREEEVDELLRREVFVDLYAVVRQGLRISHPRYSIKNVEQFYMAREAELRAGDDSIMLYERWRLEGDQAILDAIEDYNEEDCVSTFLLRDWLLDRKARREATWATEIAWRETPESHAPTRRRSRCATSASGCARVLLRARGAARSRELLDYHRREAKPGLVDSTSPAGDEPRSS